MTSLLKKVPCKFILPEQMPQALEKVDGNPSYFVRDYLLKQIVGYFVDKECVWVYGRGVGVGGRGVVASPRRVASACTPPCGTLRHCDATLTAARNGRRLSQNINILCQSYISLRTSKPFISLAKTIIIVILGCATALTTTLRHDDSFSFLFKVKIKVYLFIKCYSLACWKLSKIFRFSL